MLTAHARIALRDSTSILGRLCDHMREHGDVALAGNAGSIRLPFGTAAVAASESGLAISVSASDETNLAYMKMGVVHHVREFAAPQQPEIGWSGDGADTRVPPYFREMRVVRAFSVTPRMRRVVLRGENLARFAEGGLHVRLLFPPEGRAPVWPQLGGDGCLVWPTGDDALTVRIYTIRHLDLAASEVSIDILRHDGDTTPGSRFAMTAAPGDRVGMTGPGGGAIPAARSMILLGDETALPAIARILAGLPAGAEARAVIEVSGPEEEQPMPSAAAVSIEWLHRDAGTGRSLADAAEAVEAEAMAPDTFVWAGCEFADFRRIRRRARTDWSLPRDRHLVVAYWRKGAAGDEARADA